MRLRTRDRLKTSNTAQTEDATMADWNRGRHENQSRWRDEGAWGGGEGRGRSREGGYGGYRGYDDRSGDQGGYGGREGGWRSSPRLKVVRRPKLYSTPRSLCCSTSMTVRKAAYFPS